MGSRSTPGVPQWSCREAAKKAIAANTRAKRLRMKAIYRTLLERIGHALLLRTSWWVVFSSLSVAIYLHSGAFRPPPPLIISSAPHYLMTRSQKSVFLDLPARFQWEANFGYCGEVSLITAGLYYGQYVSQYDARAIASPGADQADEGSQLLLDENEAAAARAMKLKYQIWPKKGTTHEFLIWTKNHLLNDHPVIWGIFANTKIFKIIPERGANYDHIVPVLGFSSSHPITDQQIYPDDEITFSDNGTYAQTVKKAPLLWTYAISRFVYMRNNEPKQPYYLNDGEDSAIAILGVQDENNETLRVQVKTNTDRDEPELRDGESERPKARPVILTITVFGLIPGVAYKLYKYTDFASVPTSRFNANRRNAAKEMDINISSGGTYETTETLMSSDIAIYRAVKASGP
jgi:hypothetical protein